MKKIIFLSLFILLQFSLVAQEGEITTKLPMQETSEIDANGFGYAPPENLSSKQPVSLWATYYYVHQAKYDAKGYNLLYKDGSPTGARLSKCDWCAAVMEGTVITTDKEGNPLVLNFDRKTGKQQVDCKSCYSRIVPSGNAKFYKAKGKHGDGIKGYSLVPYRTIAVDTAIYKTGLVLFIPQAAGVTITLPDGSVSRHDGYFFTADIGSAIKGNHIDVFTGVSSENPFKFVKSKESATFDAYIISDNTELVDMIKAQHLLH